MASIYICDCPDFSKSQERVISSDEKSLAFDREWVESLAGSKADCKHILAVKLYLKDQNLGSLVDIRVSKPKSFK